MKFGEIKCTCGQVFYFETNKEFIKCTTCELSHDTLNFPVKDENVEEVVTETEDEWGEVCNWYSRIREW